MEIEVPGWVKYKLLLRELIADLIEGPHFWHKQKIIAKETGAGISTVAQWVTKPDGKHKVYNIIPNNDYHQKIVAYFRGLKKDDPRINTLDALYVKDCIPERERREKLVHDGSKLAGKAWISKALQRNDDLRPQTELTNKLVGLLKAKQVYLSTIIGTKYSAIISTLDNPIMANDNNYVGRRYLEDILAFDKFELTEIDKRCLREMFYDNCRAAVRGGQVYGDLEQIGDDNVNEVSWVDQVIGRGAFSGCMRVGAHPVVEYKIGFRILMLQAGVSAAEFSQHTCGLTRARIGQYLSLESKNIRDLPDQKTHEKACELFQIRGCNAQDLEIFRRQHEKAWEKKKVIITK